MIGHVLSGTPVWVWLLLMLLIYLGWLQSRDRIVSRLRAFMVPIIMVLWSLATALTSFSAQSGLLFWGIGFVATALMGILLCPQSAAFYDAETQRYHLSGSWVPMCLMLGIFTTKYIVGVLSAINPEALARHDVVSALVMLYGSFSGAFAARAWGLLSTEKKHPIY